jgi:uncharacterized membrane protein
MTGKNIYTLLYMLVALICVSISVYLSYWGYYSHLQGLTFLFAAVIGLLLFGSDLLIRQMKLARKSLFFPMLFFLLVAAFSGASNFNFLYTNFMQEDIAQRTVRDQFDIFREDLTSTKTALLGQRDVQDDRATRNLIETELTSLEEQLVDPLRPGCGERCREHVRNIYDLLGGAPTDLAIPSADASEAQVSRWYNNFASAVITNFEAQLTGSRYDQTRSLVQDIDGLLRQYRDPDAALREELDGRAAALLRGEGLEVISDIRQASVDIARRANAILPIDDAVEHRPIQSDLDKIGEIPVSFQDAFADRPNIGVSLVSLILAVFVDIVPILFALVIFNSDLHGNEPRSGQRPRRRVSRVAT